MKGYTMILAVNAGLLALLGGASVLYAQSLDASAARCQERTVAEPSCQQARDGAAGARAVTPYLLAASVLLAGVAWATRRPPGKRSSTANDSTPPDPSGPKPPL